MEIEISKNIKTNIEKAAKELGLSEKEVIVKALTLYFRNLEQYLMLQKEINEWEEAGIEDSNNFFERNNLWKKEKSE